MPHAIEKGGVYTIVGGKPAGHHGTVAEKHVRVWVVDDQASFRRATAATLDAMDDFVMAGECETGESAVDLIRDGDADIVLMDVHMPGMGGIEATRQIHAARPDLMVVLMSTYSRGSNGRRPRRERAAHSPGWSPRVLLPSCGWHRPPAP